MTPTRYGFCCLLLCLGLRAQSYEELKTTRNLVLPYTQLLQIEAGVLGTLATDSDPATGLDDEIAWDARALYHDEGFSGDSGAITAYAGRDGFVASLRDGRLVGDTSSRLELSAQLFNFYREGFYRGNSFVPTGQYEGEQYEVYLGFGREAQQQLFVEFGPYYRMHDFSRSDFTATNYVIPEDYDAYGIRLFLEHRTLQLDRRSGMARDGFLLTLVGEREWNDSKGLFGVDPGFQTELPDAVWRARGRIEWYIPQGEVAAWEIFARGAWSDDLDRVYNYDAWAPPGNLWVDAQLRFRIPLGDSISVSPFVHGQYVRTLQEDGGSADKDFFFGGGAEAWWHFSQQVSAHAWYSFLDNEARPSVSIEEDLRGQHMFYLGAVLRFGGSRR